LPALGATDRTFLLTAFDQLRARVTSLPTNAVPIHGDAHLGNVFMTRDGARWNDLEDVCMGPHEWDIAWLPEANLSAFEPVNRDLLAACHYLRSLCASVWCWERYDIPEKREPADYHLAYLRESGLFQH
jgi:Phosphotransferase enzyme family